MPPTLENLTESDLREVLKTKSLNKARSYVAHVRNPARSGQTLTAQVPGAHLYEIEIDVGVSGINARCTCPYDWGGYCKHVGAVLLKWIQSPASFAVVEKTPPASSEYPVEVIPVEPPPTYQPAKLPFWLATPFEARSLAYRQQLEEWLKEIKLQDLRQMAQKRGWQVKGVSKAEVIGQLIEYLVNPGEILKAVAGLDEEHRHVLRAMVLLGESASRLEDVERVAGSWGKLKSYQQISTYTRHLWEIGLAIPGEAVTSFPGRIDFVPRAVSRHLPPLLYDAVPAAADLQSDRPASELRFADPYPLVRAAGQIAMLLEQATVALRSPMPRPRLEKFYPALEEWDYDPHELQKANQAGKLVPHSALALSVPPPPRSLPDHVIERLAPVAGDEARLEFILSLLVAAGVFQPGSPVTVWPEVKEQFLRRDELAQRAILARTYFYLPNWSELWELLRDRWAGELVLKRDWRYSYFKPEHLRARLVSSRHQVLRVLASLPDDRWVALDDVLPVVHVVWPHFGRAADKAAWYSVGMENWFLTRLGDDTPLSAAEWASAQEHFVRYLIAGPLHWLGLADLSFENGRLKAMRLHGLADLYWDRVEAPQVPHPISDQARAVALPEAVITEDDSVRVNPSAISAQAHNLLDRIARLEVATTDQFVYRLDPHAAHQAFEAGVALPDIWRDWEQLLAVPVPEVIRARLTEWWNRYGQVRIYKDVTIIEFGDDYALAEMKAVTSIDKCLIAEVSPRLVLIPEEAVDVLMAELEEAGYTPKQADRV